MKCAIASTGVTKVTPGRRIAAGCRPMVPTPKGDVATVLSLPKSHDRRRQRLLAMVLCCVFHAIVLVAFLYQTGGGQSGPTGRPSSAGDLIEVNIAPLAKPRQSAPPQTITRPHDRPAPLRPDENATPSPAIVQSGAGIDGGGNSSPASATGNAPDFQQQLFSHIQKFQIYPFQARQDRQQGLVVIVFTMSRAGMVLDFRIQGSSGYPLLDQAAVDTIIRAQPLPRIPADIADPLEVEIPIQFSLPR